MRVFGILAAVVIGVGVCFAVATQPVKAEQVTLQSQITIQSIVASRLYLIVDTSNQIKEIFNNSDEQPQVVLAMLDHVGGPTVLLDENITSQYESLKPYLSFTYGIIYKQGQIKLTAGVSSYQNLPEPKFVIALQNLGIRI